MRKLFIFTHQARLGSAPKCFGIRKNGLGTHEKCPREPQRAPGQKASHLKPYSQSVSCSIIGASQESPREPRRAPESPREPQARRLLT